MVCLLEKITLAYRELLTWGDPRIAHLPLMGSPVAMLTILTAYLFFVFEVGPNIMKHRKPFELQKSIMAYNALQIIMNSFGFVLVLLWLPQVNVLCVSSDKPNLSFAHYLYFLLKTADLIETIFFVLRKKYKHISFLHMYHHTIMFVGSWATCKYIPGGQLYVVGFLNCVVHVVMYIYYFLTLWDTSYKKNLWWKRYITQLQIMQHCLVFLSFLVAILNPNCTYPKTVLIAYLPGNILMIYLFMDFYTKTYRKQSHATKEHD